MCEYYRWSDVWERRGEGNILREDLMWIFYVEYSMCAHTIGSADAYMGDSWLIHMGDIVIWVIIVNVMREYYVLNILCVHIQ